MGFRHRHTHFTHKNFPLFSQQNTKKSLHMGRLFNG
jgi:hypothetical protein